MNFFDFQEKIAKKPAKAEVPAPVASKALTVSQLTARINSCIKESFPSTVLVRGEVSNFKHHGPSGHWYFTLKDDQASIACACYKSDNARMKFMPKDGDEVLATGRLAVYAQKGTYQLYVSRLDAVGQGALELAFRQLHDKLKAEGLFDAERKRPLPLYPRRIALVTSTQTAALQDMLKVLRRYPWLTLLVFHVSVQGDGSAEQIAAALADLGRQSSDIGGVDLILLARGGGSLEDMWEFNEEIVARAIAACPIPIITGIGHEVDVSIADLVADYHAHTPTEAAQVAVQHWKTAAQTLETAGLRLRREIRTLLQEARQRLIAVERHEAFRRPMDRINQLRQLLDDRHRALSLALANRIRASAERLSRLATGLREPHPRHQVLVRRERTTAIGPRGRCPPRRRPDDSG
jgi:exodeoxyribonuclease VII large subunit